MEKEDVKGNENEPGLETGRETGRCVVNSALRMCLGCARRVAVSFSRCLAAPIARLQLKPKSKLATSYPACACAARGKVHVRLFMCTKAKCK